jgi:hypothetical protein
MMQLSQDILAYCQTESEERIARARLAFSSNNEASQFLRMNRRSVDRAMAKIINRVLEAGGSPELGQPKILVLDIETAPMAGYLWSLWKPAFNTAMIDRHTYILSWAAKWVDSDEVMFDALCRNPDYSAGDESDERMLRGIWELLDEADYIVAHNGDRFDIKKLNTRFLLNSFTPPSPYRQIDTLKIAKRMFGFDSNKLDDLLKEMYGYGKDETGGFETWRGCMRGDMDSWDTLIEYNKGDVTKLERLYLDMRAWDKMHPSAATHGGSTGKRVCTVCGSEDVKSTDKTYSTGVSVFRIFTCGACGAHMRDRASMLTSDQRSNILVKV